MRNWKLFSMIAYIDLSNGASGDMLLSALCDCGLDPEELERELRKALPNIPFSLRVQEIQRKGVRAKQTLVSGSFDPTPGHEVTYSFLTSLISDSFLSSSIKESFQAVLTRLAQVESHIHHIPLDRVHFHEIGDVDTVIDILGFLMGIKKLDIQSIYVNEASVNQGAFTSDLPLPAPATLDLLKGWKLRFLPVQAELFTPTAAALLTTLAHQVEGSFPLHYESVGYGAGHRELPELPNILRIFLGTSSAQSFERGEKIIEEVVLLETNLDDVSPQILGGLFETCLYQGALDVYVTPVTMKKNRPAFLFSVLVRPEDSERFQILLFRETPTLGLRIQPIQRQVRSRRLKKLQTPWGEIQVKETMENSHFSLSPEYEDCLRLARELKEPLYAVMTKVSAYLSSTSFTKGDES